MTDPEHPAHLLFIPTLYPVRGHLRPEIQLAIRLVEIHPQLRISIFVSHKALAAVHEEFTTPFNPRLDDWPAIDDSPAGCPDRIQLLVPGEEPPPGVSFFDAAPHIIKTYGGMLGEIRTTGSPRVGRTTHRFKDQAPTACVFDICVNVWLPGLVREVAKSNDVAPLPLIGVLAETAAHAYREWVPESLGGDFARAIREAEADVANGVEEDEAWGRRMWAKYGYLVRMPGLPPLYDYEIQAQSISPPGMFGKLVAQMYNCAHDPLVKGLVCASVREADEEAAKALESAMDKTVLCMGPQLPEGLWMEDGPSPPLEDDGARMTRFLDDMLAKHGAHSVVYISTGSLNFPTHRPEIMDYMYETLISLGIPLVASCLAANSDNGISAAKITYDEAYIAEKNAQPGALFLDNVPQWSLLKHPAIGIFVSHCGMGSASEAIVMGVPIIGLPHFSDQVPFMHFLIQRGCAVELTQVKNFTKTAVPPIPHPTHPWDEAIRSELPYEEREFDRLADGTIVVGTEDAIRAEYRDIFTRIMRNGELAGLRENMGKLRQQYIQSRKQGEMRKALHAFDEWF